MRLYPETNARREVPLRNGAVISTMNEGPGIQGKAGGEESGYKFHEKDLGRERAGLRSGEL